MTGNKKHTKTVAYGGILLALSLLALFLAGVIPGAELTAYALASFLVMVMVSETSIKGGWIFFAASCILAFVLIPNKLALFPYAGFFGLYGLVKYYIERVGKKLLELVLKLLFLNLSFGLGIYFFGAAFFGPISLPEYPNLLLAAAAQGIFLLYDRILTLLLDYCRRRFPGLL